MTTDETDDDLTRSYSALAAGTSISHYKIVSRIGVGGMGEVYLALDTTLNRKVALKFLPQHLCQDVDCRKRFTREAQAAAGLDHPNIAAIYEVGDYNDRPYYAMQIVEGQSLRDVIAGRELAITQIIEITVQVCEGLQAAHDKEITHRDIKPSNILLDSHGRVRIVDFGLASVRGSEQLTKTGSTLGTIGYMSPEQVQGREVDRRSDLFSLGVVLYEMITTRNPFRRETDAATLRAVTDDPPEPMARFKAGLPDGLQAVVDKALQKDIRLRYQHADEMLADLARMLQSQATSRVTVSQDSLGKRRYRLWLAGAVITGLAVVTLVFLKPWDNRYQGARSDSVKLAVLPFDNLGDPDDAYFAAGVADEITSKLSVIRNLRVVGSYGARQYQTKDKSIAQIGAELNVDYVLCGTVRWQKAEGASSRIRVTPQLIRVSDVSNTWSHTYERQHAEIFDVQSSIASQVASALNITLVDSERTALARPITTNMEAYDYFVRGREYFRNWSTRDVADRAITLLRRAVELDSNFVEAWVELSMALSGFFWYDWDPDSLKLEESRQAAMAAIAHDSLNAYSHVAMGYYYYYSSRNYEAALKEFTHAASYLKQNPYAIRAIGLIQRRTGQWRESLESQIAATQLDPLDASGYFEIAGTARRMRQFDVDSTWLEKGLSLFPDYEPLHYERIQFLMAKGIEPAKILAEYDTLPEKIRNGTYVTYYRAQVAYWMADYQRSLDLWKRFYTKAEDISDTAWGLTFMGDCYRELHDTSRGRECYEYAKIACDKFLSVYRFTNSGMLTLPLGIVYAELGHPHQGVRLIEEHAARIPLERDRLTGAFLLANVAQTYVRVGRYGDAMSLLDSLLSVPSEITVPMLRIDRGFAPLWDNADFQAMLKRHEQDQSL